jgi:predicted dehydrogenase
MITSSFSFTLDRPENNYRWDMEAGGGALWDVGVYPISLFQFLYDDTPKTGFASMHNENGIDLSTTAQLDFGHGRTAQFFVSFRSAWSSDTIIHGSEAQLYISHPYSNADVCEAYIRRNDKIENIEVPRQYLYSGEVENMHDVILGGKEPGVTLENSRNVLETILKLRKGKF